MSRLKEESNDPENILQLVCQESGVSTLNVPITLQRFSSGLLPVRLVAIKYRRGNRLEFIVADVEAEVDDVGEHLVEAQRKAVDVGVPDGQQELVVVLHPLEGLEGDRPQRPRDLHLFQLGSKSPEQLVSEDVGWLQDLGGQWLEGREAGDDRAQTEFEFFNCRPALDVEVGEVGQLGQGVSIEPFQVREVMDKETLEPVQPVETFLCKNSYWIEWYIEAL